MGVDLIYVQGAGVFPGAPYNCAPSSYDPFEGTPWIKADVCPNYRAAGMDGCNPSGGQSAPPSLGNSKVGDGSSCFLTSACVDALGKPDDCYELTTLRRFRDEWLANQAGGKKDIARYYSFAPSVVAQMDKQPNRIQLYTAIYNELVMPCVKLIEEGRMNEAWDLYRSYSEDLFAEYAVLAA